MSGGPLLAGARLAAADPNRSIRRLPDTRSCPESLCSALGLAATVAPLTATVLGSVEPGHSGLASGVNNAVARVAGLIAIAALGAVVATSFQSRLDSQLSGRHLTPSQPSMRWPSRDNGRS